MKIWLITKIDWTIRWKAQFDDKPEDQESDDNHCKLYLIDVQCLFKIQFQETTTVVEVLNGS